MIAALGVVALIVMALLSVSALFSAAETALTAASRARMHQAERDGDRAAARVNRLMENPETMIGSVLLGNNVINILSSALFTDVLTRSIPGAWGVAIATVVMTVMVFVFAEILPKTIAIARPDDVARALSAPTLMVVKVAGPIIYGVQWAIRKVLLPFGVKLDMETGVLAAHEEIRGAVEYHHSEGLVESRDRRMLGGVLDLTDMDVAEVMVHRTNMTMLDADEPAREVVAKALEAPFTRIPLYKEDPENIVGVLHARDLARAIAAVDGRVGDLDIMAVAKEPWFVPETTNLKEQLNAFLKKRSHFALVVDEYGTLQGLVTLEDILAEIFGELPDENQQRRPDVRRRPDGTWLVDGSVPVRELNREYEWNLPEDDATTIAGLVIQQTGTIPEPGQRFAFFGFTFEILRRQRNQITALKVTPPAAKAENS